MTRDPFPLRPLTRAQVIATIALAWLVTGFDVGVRPDGVSGAWFFVVVGVIWSALQTAWDVAQTAISFVLQNILLGLRWAITDLGKAVASGLAKAAIYTAKVLGVVWRGVRAIFTPVVQWMGKALTTIAGFLRRVFQPILDWLLRAREWITRIYDRFVRPVLQVLDVLRQVFRLLALLGFDWARAIDRALGRLSALIQLPFQWLVAKINEVIGVINRIVTLDGLLQRLTLMRSLIRDIAHLDRLFYNSQTVEFTSGEIEGLQLKHALNLPEDVERDAVQALDHDSGPVASSVREYALIFEDEMAIPLGATRSPQ